MKEHASKRKMAAQSYESLRVSFTELKKELEKLSKSDPTCGPGEEPQAEPNNEETDYPGTTLDIDKGQAEKPVLLGADGDAYSMTDVVYLWSNY